MINTASMWRHCPSSKIAVRIAASSNFIGEQFDGHMNLMVKTAKQSSVQGEQSNFRLRKKMKEHDLILKF